MEELFRDLIAFHEREGVYYIFSSHSGEIRMYPIAFSWYSSGGLLEGRTPSEAIGEGRCLLLMGPKGVIEHLKDLRSEKDEVEVLEIARNIARYIEEVAPFVERLENLVKEQTVELLRFLEEIGEVSSRNARIFLLRLKGRTYKAIAEELGLRSDEVGRVYRKLQGVLLSPSSRRHLFEEMQKGREEKESERRKNELSYPIEDLGLPRRALNRLIEAGIETLRALGERSPRELLQIRGFGESCLEAVERKLAERGLSLREDR